MSLFKPLAFLPNKKTLLVVLVSIFTLAAAAMKAVEAPQGPSEIAAKNLFKKLPSRSTTIDLSHDGKTLVNVNTQANSVSIFRVEGLDALNKLAEVPVGNEPHSVAIYSKKEAAFVTNAASGTVSVVDLKDLKTTNEITVGSEPRGCALTPSGNLLYVANFTSKTVSVIETSSETVIATINVTGNPYAVAISDDGDKKDDDERVFVTQFLARLISGGPGEGFDNGKQGVVFTFPAVANTPIAEITLSPLADSGFTANRTNLCQLLNPQAVNNTFCPDPTTPVPTPAITADPQGVFPNQLHAALIRGARLYLPNIGAQPEPPVVFDTNVQALVDVVDTTALAERADLHVNLNAQIKLEPTPADPTTLNKLFGNDIVAMDANQAGTDFLIVSRGGNYVLRATGGAEAQLNIGAPSSVIRFQTGNIPSGIVISRDGHRAYVNNEVNTSVSILDLDTNTVVTRDVSSSNPPAPGSHAHSVIMGKVAFFTALGVPATGLQDTPIRNLEPRLDRGKQSSNAWSTCGSCHPSGLADGVTWIFADGPRQTIPMDGLYSKLNGAHDARINNWSAARDSVTDFNNNSRNVQCGTGFAGGATNPAAGCPPFGSGTPNPNIYDHGISQGASEALDLQTEWSTTIRSHFQPHPVDVNPGRLVFEANCASCHGGAKWTKSQVFYLNNPALDRAFAAGGTARDPGLTVTANQIVSYSDTKVDPKALKFLEDVGTFSAANSIEIRQNGQAPLGAAGFNVPSLLGVASHAPYFHNGSAQTFDDVFIAHALGGGTIDTQLSAGDKTALKDFLNALDGRTLPTRSDGDIFKEPFSNLP